MTKARDEGFCNIVCMKTLFFVFNFIFWLAGLGIMGVGIWIIVFRSHYNSLLDSDIYVIVPGLMVAAGVVVLIVGVVGCCGAIKENRFFLISFLVMVILIFILEAAIGIVSFVYADKIRDEVQKTMKTKMNQYGVSDDVTDSIDKLQRENKCCGDTGKNSWNSTSWHQSEERGPNIVPDSCCKTESPRCGKRDHPSNINDKGCLTQVEDFFVEHFSILAAVGIGLGCTQLVGILVTVFILRFVQEY